MWTSLGSLYKNAKINLWVEDQTEGKIKNLIPEGAIGDFTYLVLANTIYFKASWSTQFDPEITYEKPFNLMDGSAVDIPMMAQTTTFPFVDANGYKAIELPYVGEEVSMLVLDSVNITIFTKQIFQDVTLQ